MAFNSAQRVFLLASTVALATLIPSVAFSQSGAPNPSPSAQPTGSTQQGQSLRQVLNLTPQQIEKIREVYIDTKQQIEGVLTTEQQNKYKEAIEAGQNEGAAIASVNLTQEQVNRIRSINQNFNNQIRGLLTEEQLQRLQNQVRQSDQSGQSGQSGQ